jgi:hypothetical protein
MSKFPRLRRELAIAFWTFTAIAVIVFVIFTVTGCGDEAASGAGCVGTVTKTYTEYKPGVGITSGNVTIPTGKTKYYIAIKRSDGTFCSRGLDKNEWLGITEGDTYG